MKKLPDRIAALEAVASPAVQHDLSEVPTAILEKLAAADIDGPLDGILSAEEVTVFELTAKRR